jgi:hypothetical protein
VLGGKLEQMLIKKAALVQIILFFFYKYMQLSKTMILYNTDSSFCSVTSTIVPADSHWVGVTHKLLWKPTFTQ